MTLYPIVRITEFLADARDRHPSLPPPLEIGGSDFVPTITFASDADLDAYLALAVIVPATDGLYAIGHVLPYAMHVRVAPLELVVTRPTGEVAS